MSASVRGASLACALLLGLSAPSLAGTPELARVLPRGAQRGQTVELRLRGRRLEAPQELLLYDEGITVASLEEVIPKPGKQGPGEVREVRARIVIAPDCAPGEQRLRLRTASGITELRTFWVGVLPEVEEVEPNGSQEQPQAVELDRTIAGRIRREDTDWFSFQARAGERITAELVAMRLGDVVFDASLRLLDERRFELASSDDTYFAGQDPVLTALIPADGTYYLVAREAAFGGNDAFEYRLHLGHFPRPAVAFPPGGQVGASADLRLLGLAAGITSQTFSFPPPGPDGIARLFPSSHLGTAPTPLRVASGALPGLLEVEPNHRAASGEIPAPGAVHGQILTPGDEDWFHFAAKAGQPLTLRVRARELGSPLDAVANVFERGGKHLVGNDDLRGDPDALVRFRAPKDGVYEVRVRDFLNRGGEAFVYRLEINPDLPSLTLDLQPIGRDTQLQQTLSVPQGGRAAVLLRTQRSGFREALQVSIAGLGSGVVSEIPEVPAAADVVPLVLQAHALAPLGGGLVAVEARSVGKAQVSGSFLQVVPLSKGDPNNAVYHTTCVDRMAIAVSAAAPFSLELLAPSSPLVHNGTKELRVRVQRAPGYTQPLRVELLYDPPGVRSQRNVLVKPDQDEVTLRLDANGKASLGAWPLVAIARGDVGGELSVSSQVVSLEVTAPPLSLQLARVALPQGGPGALGGQVTLATPLVGEARVELVSLPRHVTAEALTLQPGASTLSFALQVGAEARPGAHKIFCRVTLAGEDPVVLHTGWTELRVDRPAPAAPAPVAAPKPAPPPPPAEVKQAPLRRLDQLRAEYQAAKAEEGTP